jgi:UDP-N-acetylmuramate--alanine ligase
MDKKMKSILNKISSHIFFVGIGGIGMSGIAEIMNNLGYKISGSDISENVNTKRLKNLGVDIFIGHSEDNLENVDYVVISSAIKMNNPEIKAATANKIPVIKRAEMLAELMRFKGTSISVSGSHGKTTTTALMACMLEGGGLNPSVINGGIINNKSTNAYIGQSEYVIVEADESDATFIKVPSTISVITNIDPEHLDFYGSFENLIKAFETFITNLPFYGFAVACIDNKTTRNLVENIIERKVITYGIDSEDADVRAHNIRPGNFSSKFDVTIKSGKDETTLIKDVELSTPGRHNVLNSLSCIAVAYQLGFNNNIIRNSLKNFEGVKRRFTRICEYNGALVIDDYAHHPAEIAATLSTAKDLIKDSGGKIYSIYQPHRYTRLQNLFKEFTECFDGVDELYIMDVYPAGEVVIKGFESGDLIKSISEKNHSFPVSILRDITDAEKIAAKISNNDLLLFMGAGTITYMAADLGEILNKKSRIVA